MLIRELRKQHGLTMRELGEKIGVSESTISLYETGKREPNYETLLKIAELFNVSVDYLLRGEDAPAYKTPITDDDIKFALFGGGPVTDEQFEEVKRFAQFIKERDTRPKDH